jgi:hypothetical protein
VFSSINVIVSIVNLCVICYKVEQFIFAFIQSREKPEKLERRVEPQGMVRETPLTSGKQENVIFSDATSGTLTGPVTQIDHTRTVQDTGDASLQDFFRRPIKINTITWVHNNTLYTTFNPWSLYFENPRVINRLTNFNLLRAKLHVKFTINGSGFAMGRAIASYFPLHTLSNVGLPEVDSRSVILESQRPHVFLNPTTSEGGSLELPFFWVRNNLSIPDSEWNDMGQITLRSFTALDNANGSTSNVTISVIAWAEDVELSVLTTLDPTTLVAQGKMTETDIANNEGTISGPASTAAKVANSLSLIPSIRPFALASEMLLNTTAHIAKIFGYSRPNIIKAPEPYRPTPIGSLASCTTPEAVAKLTVDDRQELCVDSGISGISEGDPLAIANIATRESYYHQFSWATTTAPDVLIANMVVSPRVWQSTGSKYFFPACAAASLPFESWTGSVKYRFQIMSSTFHKGRLKITYDPNYVGSEEMNVTYSRIVDIQEETDFTIEVKNGQTTTFLDMHDPIVTPDSDLFSGTRFATAPSAGNGVLSVSVLNSLTTPNPTAGTTVWINVFVSAGDDIEFATPGQKIVDYVIEPQGKMTETVVDTDAFSNKQDHMEQPNESVLMHSQDYRGDTAKVFYGERILSFRTLLKRYNLHSSIGALSSLDRVISSVRSHFPYFRGNVTGAVHTTALAAPYNYCNTILLHYVTLMFAGYRGSIRYKIVPIGDGDNAYNNVIYVERILETPGASRHSDVLSGLPTLSTQSQAAASVVWRTAIDTSPPLGLNGSAYTTSEVNPVLEFEVPHYSRRRFLPSRMQDRTSSTTDEDLLGSAFWMKAYIEGTSNTRLDVHVAAGEDFNTYFFLGLPPLHYEATVPAPSV